MDEAAVAEDLAAAFAPSDVDVLVEVAAAGSGDGQHHGASRQGENSDQRRRRHGGRVKELREQMCEKTIYADRRRGIYGSVGWWRVADAAVAVVVQS